MRRSAIQIEIFTFFTDLYFAGIFSFFRHEIPEFRWPFAAKFCCMIGSVFNSIMLVKKF